MRAFNRIFLAVLFFTCFTQSSFAQGEWEHRIVRDINPQVPSSDVWKTISASAQPLSVLVPAGMLAAAYIDKNKNAQRNAYEALGGLVITTVFTQALKTTVKRDRPYLTYTDIYPDEIKNSYSFPSNHTSLAFSTATSLALTTRKWYITVPAFAWAAGVGYSRMYLGQHYPSDVFAGALVGAGSAWAAHWLQKKLFVKK